MGFPCLGGHWHLDPARYHARDGRFLDVQNWENIMKPWDICARGFVDKWLQKDYQRTLRICGETLVASDGCGNVIEKSNYWDLSCELGWPRDPEHCYMELMKLLEEGRAQNMSESEEDALLDQMDVIWYQLTKDQQKVINDFFKASPW